MEKREDEESRGLGLVSGLLRCGVVYFSLF